MLKVRTVVISAIDNIKERARAAKLKRDVNNLRTALGEQWEQLGTLTLEHRPTEVDITAELGELAQLHEALPEKQEALDSLRQTHRVVTTVP